VENLETSQFLQTLTPVLEEYLPARQCKQVLAVVAPMVVEKLPALQLLQPVDAVISMYFPVGQFMQDSAAKVFVYVPAMHGVHAVEPVLFLYVPVVQPEHCMPAGPVYPLLHTHASMFICADKECPEYNGQMVHPVVAYHCALNPENTTLLSVENTT
jgi:hypothetical protein